VWAKQESSLKQTVLLAACCLSVCLMGLLYDPEDGGSMFFQDVSKVLPITEGGIIQVSINSIKVLTGVSLYEDNVFCLR
jgi:hypothetical protein